MVLLSLCLTGCQPAPQASNANSPAVVVSHPGSVGSVQGPAPLPAFDPCGDRVEDLCGALAQYYQAKSHGPAQIEELVPFAPLGVQLQFTCPVSGKKYLCAPGGLQATGETIRIYLYDAEPVHAGQRWYAYTKPGNVNGAVIFFTDHMPEARFKHFLEAGIASAAVN